MRSYTVRCSAPAPKIKKNPPQENFLYSNVKRFSIFSQKKAALIFQGTKPPKKFQLGKQKNPPQENFL